MIIVNLKVNITYFIHFNLKNVFMIFFFFNISLPLLRNPHLVLTFLWCYGHETNPTIMDRVRCSSLLDVRSWASFSFPVRLMSVMLTPLAGDRYDTCQYQSSHYSHIILYKRTYICVRTRKQKLHGHPRILYLWLRLTKLNLFYTAWKNVES